MKTLIERRHISISNIYEHIGYKDQRYVGVLVYVCTGLITVVSVTIQALAQTQSLHAQSSA